MKTNKKIAFFLGNLGIGGVERVSLIYANELVKRGWNVEFVLAKGGGKLESDLSNDIKLIKFGEPRVRNSFIKLWKYVHKEKPDYVITGGDITNLMVILACLFSNSKAIISQHNYNDIEASNQGWWSRFQFLMMRCCYPMAYKILAVSEGISDFLVNHVGINKNRIEVLYNPLNVKSLKEKVSLNTDLILPEKYILFVGRLSPVKNLSLLMKAFDKADIGDTSLVIVGDGSLRDALELERDNMIKSDHVIFTGSVSNPMPYIRNCSALVLCSYSEAFPTVLLEAMALDKPIAATPTLGAKEILGSKEGAYISKSFDDIQEFSRILELSVECGNSKLSRYVTQYDMNATIERLSQMLK